MFAHSTRLLAWFCAASLSVGCATTGPTAPRAFTAADYYPLAKGNRWVFQVRPAAFGQEEQVVELADVDEDGFFTSNVGARLQSRSQGIFDGQRFLIEAPLEVGHRWLAVPSVSTVERYRIVQTGVRMRVPAGSFSGCLQVETEQPIRAQDGRSGRLIGVWTYAPHIGPIHFVQHVELDGAAPVLNVEFQLVEVKLASPSQPPEHVAP